MNWTIIIITPKGYISSNRKIKDNYTYFGWSNFNNPQ